jgi:GNAT superfamily N-acetyltransferase
MRPWSDEQKGALLREHRGRGRGTALMEDILDEAAALGQPVTIHVDKSSPALRLYQRLRFMKVRDEGVCDIMRWTPNQANTAS